MIQSHVVAMYAPSARGRVLDRPSRHDSACVDGPALAACAILGLASRAWLAYWASLVSLGIGQNVLFLGATVRLNGAIGPTGGSVPRG